VESTPKSIVLVHGAWHAGWCWERVVPLLERRGFSVRAVDLPSTAADSAPEADLSADALEVRRAIDAIPGEVLVCGHSYGGMVISHSAVGSHPRVAHLAYLCAFMPASGESLLSFGDGTPAPWICEEEGGMTIPDRHRAAEIFYNDCEPDVGRRAIERLRPQPATTFSGRVASPSWERIASTYILCSQDKALPVPMQREVFAPRARRVVELESGHSPFLSRPDELAQRLLDCWQRHDRD
jgi:pimeloyl-ACP methyl ester carboxylesterase